MEKNNKKKTKNNKNNKNINNKNINKKSTKNKKNINNKINKNINKNNNSNFIMKGGEVGTSGNFSTLVSDIEAMATSMVDTIINSAELVLDIFELPGDLGTAYKDKGAPGANL